MDDSSETKAPPAAPSGSQPVAPAEKPAPTAAAAAPSAAPTPAAKPAAPKPAPARPAAGGAGAEHAAKAAPPAGPPAPPPPATVTVPAFITGLQAALPGAVAHVSYWVGDWTVIVTVGSLLDVLQHLRDAPDAALDLCSDVTATDWP